MPDLHLRGTAPARRTDEYYNTQFEKLEFCFETFENGGVEIVCFPGDVFNNYGRDPYYLLVDLLELMSRYSFEVVMVYGQHDLRFHDLEDRNCPARAIITSGSATLLSGFPHIVADAHFYGSSWGESIPEPKTKEAYNVLVCHKTIGKAWKTQKDFTPAKHFLKRNAFDLIIAGDNHARFHAHTRNGRHLLNSGSLCRMESDQADHKPCCSIVDTATKEYQIIDVPVKPFEEIMDLSEEPEPTQVEYSEEYLSSFVKGLEKKMGHGNRSAYRNALDKLTETTNPNVKKIVKECYDG